MWRSHDAEAAFIGAAPDIPNAVAVMCPKKGNNVVMKSATNSERYV